MRLPETLTETETLMRLPETLTETDVAPLIAEVDEAPFPVCFLVVTGSHSFGLSNAGSDVDLRGMMEAPTDRFLGITPPASHYTAPDFDISIAELSKFVTGAARSDVNILEQIHSPFVIREDPLVSALRSMDELLTVELADRYLRQAVAHSRTIDREMEKGRTEKARKAARHALRLTYGAYSLLTDRKVLVHLPVELATKVKSKESVVTASYFEEPVAHLEEMLSENRVGLSSGVDIDNLNSLMVKYRLRVTDSQG
jgi:predicted nucleotidyltransferase